MRRTLKALRFAIISACCAYARTLATEPYGASGSTWIWSALSSWPTIRQDGSSQLRQPERCADNDGRDIGQPSEANAQASDFR
jgi:hypothetical protein